MRACKEDALHKRFLLRHPAASANILSSPSPLRSGDSGHTHALTDNDRPFKHSLAPSRWVVLCERQHMRPRHGEFKRTSLLNCWVSLNTFKWRNGKCHNKGISRLGLANGWEYFPLLSFLFIFWSIQTNRQPTLSQAPWELNNKRDSPFYSQHKEVCVLYNQTYRP